MTIALIGLLLLLAFAVASVIAQAHRHDRQISRLLTLHSTERAQATPDLTELIALAERLCQRIQAPEQAIMDHTIAQPISAELTPQAVLPDDDAGWHIARGLATKEQLADEAMAEELAVGG